MVRVDFLSITWLPPLYPNGAILSYEVSYKLKDTTNNWIVVQQPRVGPDVLTADVQGLAGDRYYLFRVASRTRLGKGDAAVEIVKTTPNRRGYSYHITVAVHLC